MEMKVKEQILKLSEFPLIHFSNYNFNENREFVNEPCTRAMWHATSISQNSISSNVCVQFAELLVSRSETQKSSQKL